MKRAICITTLLVVALAFNVQSAIASYIFLRDGAGIKRADLDGTGLTTIIAGGNAPGTAIFGSQYLADIEVDATNQKIYWQSATGIRSANFDGTGETLLVSSGTFRNGAGLTLDIPNNRAYWGARSSTTSLVLQTALLDNTGLTTLQTINVSDGTRDVFDLELDPTATGTLYFNMGRDGANDGDWRRSAVAGGSHTKVIDTPTWGRGGIVVDLDNSRVYGTSGTGGASNMQRNVLGGSTGTETTLVSGSSQALMYIDRDGTTMYGTSVSGGVGQVLTYNLLTEPSDFDTGSPLIASTGHNSIPGIALFIESAAATPEPSTFVLALLGLVSLGLVVRRRRTRVERSLTPES